MAASPRQKILTALYDKMKHGANRDDSLHVLVRLAMYEEDKTPDIHYWRDVLLAHVSKGVVPKETEKQEASKGAFG